MGYGDRDSFYPDKTIQSPYISRDGQTAFDYCFAEH